jgi:ribosome maturation factor RimP
VLEIAKVLHSAKFIFHIVEIFDRIRNVNVMGFISPFFICGGAMTLEELLESTLEGMGYELVEVERLAHNKLLRIYVDKVGGINIDDCVAISNHLSRLLVVENIDYGRLEVSSPGLDRPLRKASDFLRFKGEVIKLKLRIPMQGQRNFVGILREINDGIIKLEVDGKLLDLELNNLGKARLVPKL